MPLRSASRDVEARPDLVVNDIHSRLNRTVVGRIERVASLEAIRRALEGARRDRMSVSVAGGRHAMGGQQFGTGSVLLDMTSLHRVLRFDERRGTVEVEAGVVWPRLVEDLATLQQGRRARWGIRQKQTGADRLTLGGAVAANIHGRGLALPPLVGDVEALSLVDARGRLLRCSRARNRELFRLAIGGYGLFGVVYSVTLRLAPRRKLQRVVEVCPTAQVMHRLERRVTHGFLSGDFQFCTDAAGDRFMREGVLSCYRPVDPGTPVPADQKDLSVADWEELIRLAHVDKAEAYRRYVNHYLATSGQIYWSDMHQLGTYVEDYHPRLDRRLGARHPGSEMITEIYVPREAFGEAMEQARAELLRCGADLIYGTGRLIGRDRESWLAWARRPWACIVFNLHVEHTPDGVREAGAAFRRLIDVAVRRGGSFYLTYHRFATRRQLLACHPRLRAFLSRKLAHDPEERFQNDWYRHCKSLLASRDSEFSG